ncbi:MAG: DUF2088 domain-containing protein, partial [Verrucomicrobiales bacterium]|nr:DUF2088 domain-containing protein [Verrucomicrobiales bacterium]
MSVTEWFRYFSDGPRSPRTHPCRNSRYWVPSEASNRYRSRNARSISGETGARSRSNGPPGANRTRPNASRLINPIRGISINTRLKQCPSIPRGSEFRSVPRPRSIAQTPTDTQPPIPRSHPLSLPEPVRGRTSRVRPENALAVTAADSRSVTSDEVRRLVAQTCPTSLYRGRRVLIIVPDHTRTAPVGTLFKAIHEAIGDAAAALDVLVALGTHPPMSEEAICQRLEITAAERTSKYARVGFHNHEWDNPAALKTLGTLTSDEVSQLTGGLFAMDVPVEINRRLFEYDQVIIVGPVFPHEVVGFSGGNKYLFPGVGGPQILNFFHWLGAVVTNPMIIGNQWTPVRKVVDRAGSLVSVPKLCFAMVVRPDKSLAGLFAGSPEEAWTGASDLSRQIHITYKDRPFRTILSCAPTMYDELWTGGKCMYKLEPVLADGGELIIYAPHITEISLTHGRIL